jgi:hypothetical protein
MLPGNFGGIPGLRAYHAPANPNVLDFNPSPLTCRNDVTKKTLSESRTQRYRMYPGESCPTPNASIPTGGGPAKDKVPWAIPPMIAEIAPICPHDDELSYRRQARFKPGTPAKIKSAPDGWPSDLMLAVSVTEIS